MTYLYFFLFFMFYVFFYAYRYLLLVLFDTKEFCGWKFSIRKCNQVNSLQRSFLDLKVSLSVYKNLFLDKNT